MPKILSNSVPDGINKKFGLIKALAKADFEFFPGDRDVDFILYLSLVLLPTKQGSILEENGDKWHPILILGLGVGKMILTLLGKIIALQMSFTPIYVWKLSL